MKIIVKADELLEKLNKIKPYISTSPKIHTHKDIQIEVSETIKLRTYDGLTIAEALLQGSIEEVGSILVNPKSILQYLQSVPGKDLIELTITPKNDVEIKRNNQPYYFRGSSGAHPGIKIKNDEYSLIDLKELDNALAVIKDTVGNGGVQIISENKKLQLNATDNYRLGHCTLTNGGFGEFNGSLPYNMLEKISKLNFTHVYYDTHGKTLTFSNNNYAVQTRLIAQEFPNASGLLETMPDVSFEVKRTELLEKLKRLEAVAENQPLKIYCDTNIINIEAKNTDIGYGKEEIKLETKLPYEFEVYLHSKYLTQAVASFNSELIEVCYSSSLAPVFVKNTNNPYGVHVIMPVKA